ncbi:glycosyltransferase [Streptomyces sp. NPDC059866]|uniref:glycosyltransferase n=1 Tax=Streptomyces sp. NPDC059866 TaxID=3346978 RepID=UPI0036515A3E
MAGTTDTGVNCVASGTLVVASASGGPLGFVRSGGPRPTGWLLAPGSTDDLHATLLSALAHPEEFARRGRNARDFVVQHYSWRTIADRYAQMYDRVQTSARAWRPRPRAAGPGPSRSTPSGRCGNHS